MNFTKRAFLYVTRKRGKSFLLFIILLVMATFVLTGLSIWKASEAAQQKLRQSLGAGFDVAVDWSEDNPYIVTENMEEKVGDNGKKILNFITYSTKQLTPENVKAIKGLDGVKYCSASTEVLAVFDELSLFPGKVPVEADFARHTKVLGVWGTEDNELFAAGELKLTQGRHITEGDVEKVVISEDLAEKNGLKLGDYITTRSTKDKEIKVQIVGLFMPRQIESEGDMVTSYDKIQNRVFSDLNTAVLIEDGPAIQGFTEINVTVEDPGELDRIMSQVRALDDIDWDAFMVAVDNEAYLNAVQPLTSLKELVATLLLVIIAVSAIILALILTLWTKTRIHETGVLLSIGIKKSAIMGQYLVEVLLIAVVAFGLSYVTSNAVAGQIGSRLLAQNVERENTAQQGASAEDGAASAVVEADEGQVASDTASDIQITIGLDMVGLLYVIGFAVITVAVGVSSISVMRLKPGQILSKMS